MPRDAPRDRRHARLDGRLDGARASVALDPGALGVTVRVVDARRAHARGRFRLAPLVAGRFGRRVRCEHRLGDLEERLADATVWA